MLDARYTLRHTREVDIEGAQAAVDAAQADLMGERRRGEIEVAAATRDPRMALADNTWVVEAPGGGIAAFAFLFWGSTAQGEADVYVHPAHLERGAGGALLDAVERRAAALAATAPSVTAPRLHVWCDDTRLARRAALAERGFHVVRESYLMRLDLDERAPDPWPLPAGIELRPFAPGRDEEAVFIATEEAYTDHFLFSPSTMDEWRLHTVEHPRFDPSLWLLAWAGSEVAGETMAFADEAELYVDSVSVRRPWRGRGLGLALLTRAFALAAERSLGKVRLGVDARNPTGALALYLKAGMRIERRDEVYAKDLRSHGARR